NPPDGGRVALQAFCDGPDRLASSDSQDDAGVLDLEPAEPAVMCHRFQDWQVSRGNTQGARLTPTHGFPLWFFRRFGERRWSGESVKGREGMQRRSRNRERMRGQSLREEGWMMPGEIQHDRASVRLQHAPAQQPETSSTVHLTLDRFRPIHLT